jgi:glycerophosphoryl diester phosphodiesterase
MRNILSVKIFVLAATILSLSFSSCDSSKKSAGNKDYPAFFKIGHRGTRGLMPENTIPAMNKGLAVGANTIEFDVHISKDGQVLVYHDESFNPDYTTMPDGSDIPKEKRKDYTFYQNNYADIRKFIIGEKDYPLFPQQQRMASYTPLLSELIDSVEAYTKQHSLPAPYYLLEIKSKEKTDGFEQPAPEEYMKILMDVVNAKHLGKRLFIQSFDMRPLQVLHREHPELKLGFLTDNKTATFEENIAKLGFNPALYNPNYKLVTEELVRKCHAAKMLIEPWTVNTLEDMKKMKALNVDGIITDYPNLFRDL